jgi:23S rRNA (cytidine1920-2'-O)/16S rRNA (cytidine1409-2'-O)-methyltransferase
MKKQRLDLLLVEKGLSESRNQAQRLIMAGEVLVDGRMVIKPSETCTGEENFQLKEQPPFIYRGGEKLAAALQAFELTALKGITAADIGASAGGFTDCLLQHGAKKVYAVDVGYGQLHWKLRNDERVVVMEKTNIRDLKDLPEKMELVVVDVSFISLRAIFPHLLMLMKTDGLGLITLIKPQFEAGREEAARGKGVIRDHAVHRSVLTSVIEAAQGHGLFLHGLIESPIKGPKGNIEFLAYFKLQPALSSPDSSIKRLFDTINEKEKRCPDA